MFLAGWLPALRAEAQTVGSEAQGDGCSTAVVRGLTDQLVAELNCLYPGTLETFEENDTVQFASAAVIPVLQPPALAELRDALEERPGEVLVIQSALRSLPQQYLLYEWWQGGRCAIQIAASPGHSNHEGGLAIDIDEHALWRDALEAHGWQWYGDDDRVHFTYYAGDDIRAASVLAFQVLWNANHPEDQIDEDGIYGPQTEGRLTESPVDGFPFGTTCPACERGLRSRFIAAVAPRDAALGDEVAIEVTFANAGDQTWVVGRVRLATNPPAELDRDVIAGDSASFELSWTARAVGDSLIRFELEDETGAPLPAGCDGEAFGELVIRVSDSQGSDPDPTDLDAGDSGEGDGGSSEPGFDDRGPWLAGSSGCGGCSGARGRTRPSAGTALAAIAALLMALRRRRP